MRTVATIEARMGSTRLPGKVLMDIGGIRSLECQILRLKRSKLIDDIVIASTTNSIDDVLVEFGNEIGVQVFRGSEQDILKRILGAAKSIQGDLQVQITGDCPLIDPEIVDQVINAYLLKKGSVDFVSNEIQRSYPIGLDCRVFPVDVLDEINHLCKDPLHRVHGSTYIYAGPGKSRYKVLNIKAPDCLNFPNWRWTLDTSEDLKFFRKIAEKFNKSLLELNSIELAEWLQQNPSVLKINQDIKQKVLEDG